MSTTKDNDLNFGLVPALPIRDLVAPPAIIQAAGRPAETAFRDFFDGMLPNDNTRRAYNQAIGQFFTWSTARGLSLVQIKPGDVGVYLRGHAGGISTKKQHRSALKRFFDLLVERHICLINPAAVAKTEKLSIKQGLTPEIAKDEVRTLLTSLESDSLSAVRDRAAISLSLNPRQSSKMQRLKNSISFGQRNIPRKQTISSHSWQPTRNAYKRFVICLVHP